MPFPFSYQKELYIENNLQKTEKILFSIADEFKNSGAEEIILNEYKMSLNINKSLLKFFYQIQFKLLYLEDTKLVWKFDVIDLFKIIFGIEILMLFVFRYQLINYLIFSITFIPVFYLINVFFINSFIQNKVQTLLESKEIEFSTEKIDFEEDDIIESEIYPPTLSVHASKFGGFKVRYFYREKKKK